MFDIKELLFPNILTLIVQLCATFVIYLVYRKYLHKPVIKLLDERAEKFQEKYTEIENLKVQQAQDKEAFEIEKKKQQEALKRMKETMVSDLESTRKEMLNETQQEIKVLKENANTNIQQQKEKMLKEVETEVISVAYQLSEKALQDYVIDEQQIMNALNKEMERKRYDAS